MEGWKALSLGLPRILSVEDEQSQGKQNQGRIMAREQEITRRTCQWHCLKPSSLFPISNRLGLSHEGVTSYKALVPSVEKVGLGNRHSLY